MSSFKSWVDYFSLLLILNLEFRDDRRREMKNELDNVDIEINGNVQFFKAVRPNDKGKFSSIGARGCFESHLEMLRKAKNLGAERLLIMEDDLTIAPLFNSKMNFYIEELSDLDWDIVYFGYHMDKEYEIPDVNGYKYLPNDVPVGATHFYAVNATVIDMLIEFLEVVASREAGDPRGGPMHVDGAITTFRLQNPNVKTLIATPCLGFQRPSRTDIGETHFLDKFSLLDPLVTLLRKLKRRLKG